MTTRPPSFWTRPAGWFLLGWWACLGFHWLIDWAAAVGREQGRQEVRDE